MKVLSISLPEAVPAGASLHAWSRSGVTHAIAVWQDDEDEPHAAYVTPSGDVVMGTFDATREEFTAPMITPLLIFVRLGGALELISVEDLEARRDDEHDETEDEDEDEQEDENA